MNAASGSGDLLVRGPADPLLKIDQPRSRECRMSMAINESRKYHPAVTINFLELAPIAFYPSVTKDLTLRACGNDLPARAEYRCIFNQSDFIECGPSAGRRLAPQGKKLADVGQKEVRTALDPATCFDHPITRSTDHPISSAP